MGRPKKYTPIIETLDPDQLHTAASIVTVAVGERLLDPTTEPSLAMLRIRICMGRLARNYDFPRRGDGLLKMKGQRIVPAWYGWRWQKTLLGRCHE